MDITKTIFGLTKNNKGFFKSEKQGNFLRDILTKSQGYISMGDMYGTGVGAFVSYDDKGITKVQTYTKNGAGNVIFLREVKGQLNDLQIKDIKRMERKIAKLRKELDFRYTAWESGSYNRSGDPSTYSEDDRTIYLKFNKRKEDAIQSMLTKIDKIKNQ